MLDNKIYLDENIENNCNAEEKSSKQIAREMLIKQYNTGVIAGGYQLSQMILDALNNKSKPLMKRISDAKKICNNFMDNVSSLMKVAKEESDNPEEDDEK